MDLTQFDSRKRAEKGVFVALKDQFTGEPIGEGDKAPGFIVRGNAAPSVQARLAELQRKAGDATEADQDAAMENLHKMLIDSAMRYIVRAVNIEVEGKAVDDDPAGIRSVLDMTFPEMRIVKDENGRNIQQTVKDKDGKEVTVPQFEMANDPWAQQVIKAAEDGQRFFGKTPSA